MTAPPEFRHHIADRYHAGITAALAKARDNLAHRCDIGFIHAGSPANIWQPQPQSEPKTANARHIYKKGKYAYPDNVGRGGLVPPRAASAIRWLNAILRAAHAPRHRPAARHQRA